MHKTFFSKTISCWVISWHDLIRTGAQHFDGCFVGPKILENFIGSQRVASRNTWMRSCVQKLKASEHRDSKQWRAQICHSSILSKTAASTWSGGLWSHWFDLKKWVTSPRIDKEWQSECSSVLEQGTVSSYHLDMWHVSLMSGLEPFAVQNLLHTCRMAFPSGCIGSGGLCVDHQCIFGALDVHAS